MSIAELTVEPQVQALPPATKPVNCRQMSALAPAPTRSHRFSVEQYHRLIEVGVLSENDKVELLNGYILQMPPVGAEHFHATLTAADILNRIKPAKCCVRPQGPISLEASEPEPDVVLALGSLADFKHRHPQPSEVLLVIEVSETSLTYDREVKRLAYAAAGIPSYWIINLIDRCVEVYREPISTATGWDYRSREIILPPGYCKLEIAGQAIAEIPVVELLP